MPQPPAVAQLGGKRDGHNIMESQNALLWFGRDLKVIKSNALQ